MTRIRVPEAAKCPRCGRHCRLLCDGTLPVHTPQGRPYAPACTELRPWETGPTVCPTCRNWRGNHDPFCPDKGTA